eukprot:scaffold30163_cov124-Isochrysis_galbana.AAC.5
MRTVAVRAKLTRCSSRELRGSCGSEGMATADGWLGDPHDQCVRKEPQQHCAGRWDGEPGVDLFHRPHEGQHAVCAHGRLARPPARPPVTCFVAPHRGNNPAGGLSADQDQTRRREPKLTAASWLPLLP